jgi:hypothetical protein
MERNANSWRETKKIVVMSVKKHTKKLEFPD